MLLLWHILVFIIMLLKNGENWPRPFFSIYGMAKFKHQSTLECYICPKYCLKIAQKLNNTDFIYLVLSNFVTISRINYWDQVNSWKKKWKFWNGPLCRNKSAPFPLINFAAYCKSSNTEAFAKNLFQILTKNIDNWRVGIGLRIHVRHCR